MDPKAFDRAIQRYDPDLRLRWGLHPRDEHLISQGKEIPYDRRRWRWAIWRLNPNTGRFVTITAIETDEGGFRMPCERDLFWLYEHDAYKWTRGRKRPTEAQMRRLEGELLGEDALAARKAKERQDRLEFYRKELAPVTYRSVNKDLRGNLF